MEIFRQILIATVFLVLITGTLLYVSKANKATPAPTDSRTPEEIRCEGCKGCKFTV